jgi:GT2 family glycosyltransferase
VKRDNKVFDVVIVNYNSTDDLLRCLQSIEAADGGLMSNIFVQDNASEDYVDRVFHEFPQVIVSKQSRNIGFARAINKALSQSEAPYVVLINPDTIVCDGCFESVLEYMKGNPDVGIVGPRILDADGGTQGSARAFPTPFTGLFGRNAFLSKCFPNNPITRANMLTSRCNGKTPIEVDWVSGACMVVRRKAIEDVGLMDPRFFLYWEDADWCRRMWQKGWKVIYHPVPTVIHSVGASSSTRPFRSLIEFHKSSYRLFDKHTRDSLGIMNPLVAGVLALRLGVSILLKKMEGLKSNYSGSRFKGSGFRG